MKSRILLASFLATTSNSIAQTNSNWTGSVDLQWNNFANWDSGLVPCNSGGTLFNAFLHPGTGPVFMPSNCALEFVQIANGANISLNNGITFTVHNAVTNNGMISPNSSESGTTLFFADTTGDSMVTIAGLGEVFLSHPNDTFTGTANHTIENGGGHSVRGHGQFGTNAVNILNNGAIIADSAGNSLIVDTRSTVTQNGFLVARNGGILRLLTGTYNVHPASSSIISEDNSEIQLDGMTINGGSFDVFNPDSILSNNIVRVVNNSTINGTRNRSWLTVDHARTLSALGGDIVNDGQILLEGAASTSTLFFGDTSDSAISIGGNGRIFIDSPNDRISGTANHFLTHQSPHVIEGGGSLGENAINIINHSLVTGNNPGVPLLIDPRTSWLNDGGTLAASGGAKVELFNANYTCTNGGRFVVSDGSEIALNGISMFDCRLEPDNLNGNLADNIYRIVNNTSMSGATVNAPIHVDNARMLSIVGDDLVNNAEISLNAAASTSTFSISDTSDNLVQVSGTGKINLDSANDHITGTSNHLLQHTANHTIEGFGSLGLNSINVLNQGMIQSNVSGSTLFIDPRTSFVNDGGTLQAVGGGMINLASGVYSPLNGGQFLIGDNSRFDLSGITMENLTLDIIDTDTNTLNNLAHVTNNSIFNEVTNEANLHVDDARMLTLQQDTFTNNGTVTLDGSTSTSTLSINGGPDFSFEVNGTGTVFIDDSVQDRISGTTNHTLFHGTNHTIEGAGHLGGNSLNLINHGLIDSNINGGTITLDPRSSFQNDGGILRAIGGGDINFQPAGYASINGGEYFIGDGSSFSLSGVTMSNLTLDVMDTDLTLNNNLAYISTNSTFNNVINEADLHINNARILTVNNGGLTNNASVILDGVSGSSTLFFNGGGTFQVELDGTGTVFLDDSTHDRVSGQINHALIQRSDHTIEGSGQVGLNSLNILNRGLIQANLAGQNLSIDPRSSFVNDGGALEARNSSLITLAQGTYTSINNGLYLVEDDSAFELIGPTLSNMTLDVEDLDLDLSNNTATISTTSTFSNLTNNAKVFVNDARSIIVTPGDLTNNGIIELGSTGSLTTISINGSSDFNISFGGTGRILLDSSNERITGTFNHVLTNEAGHTIEGGGNIGVNSIYLLNLGTMMANDPATPLVIDHRSGSFTNSGSLLAQNTSTLNIVDPLFHRDGLVHAEAGSIVDCNSTFTQVDGVTRVDGILDATSLNVTGGVVQGSGDITAPLSATFSLVSPGNSTGALTIDSADFRTGSSLRIEVNKSSDFDRLIIDAGALNLIGGALQLGYFGGPTDVLPTDVITVVSTTGGVGGQFVNVADGARLNTTDGTASFVVNYLASSITLTDFIYNPGGVPNQDPVITTATTVYNVAENSPLGTGITNITAQDPEGAVISFSLTPGQPFAINEHTGAITTSGPLDYESQTSYNLIVTASDGVNQDTLAITINIDNVVENNQEVVTNVLTSAGGPFPGETNRNIIDIDADPDQDGQLNIFEVWRGTDAGTPDQPTPLIFEEFNFGGSNRGSVIIETDSAADNALVIKAEMSFDLVTWRDVSANRIIISDTAGIRTIRYYDTVPLPVGSDHYTRFSAVATDSP